MTKRTVTAVIVVFSAFQSLWAGDTVSSNQISQVTEAIARLKAASNYSWTATVQIPVLPFALEPGHGQADREGFARITEKIGDSTADVVLKGDKVVAKVEDGWQLIGKDGGPETYNAWALTRNGAAAEEAGIILKQLKEVKTVEGGAVGGDLTSEGATDLLTFGPRKASGASRFPPPKEAKGSAKFWVQNGALTKYELHLHGTMTFGELEIEIDLMRTVEFQNVGTTKMDIPDEARNKLEDKAATTPPVK